MIAIVDCGSGNLRSVEKAFENLGFDARITDDTGAVENAAGVVLPGQGFFRECVEGLRERALTQPVLDAIAAGKPFLGICVGLQMLFEGSDESPDVAGFGLFKGRVRKFTDLPREFKIPHMGWNQIKFCMNSAPPLFEGIDSGDYFYFVHSFYGDPDIKEDALCRTSYGVSFASGVWRDKVFGLQFHPEKSQSKGLTILRNFGRMCDG
ncbi:imidazole glycerol phosphate synthase subunit HisH [Candidatus Hydrogenedentota bacterium]